MVCEDTETAGRIHAYELENRPYTEAELTLLMERECPADWYYDPDDDREFISNPTDADWPF